ncbi:MAG: DUF4403 family protein [Gemmatimonadota bacterium]|nr:DUF4403 family protein [Gemmatimonadota bacterium]
MSRSVLLLVLLSGCSDRIEAPVPVARGTVVADSSLTLLPSVLDLPVEYDLGPALVWLESVVPRRMGDVDERLEVPDNSRLSFAYAAERTPFQLTLDGTTATLSAVVTYQGRGWYNPPVLPTISGSCGIDDETPPRAFLSVRTTVTPTSDWRLRGRTRVVELRPLTEEQRDRCTVTLAEVNVTDRVLEAVRGVLTRELLQVDRSLAEFGLQGIVTDVWEFLATPLKLQDSLWLVIDPAAIRFDKVRSEGTVLHSSLGITAYPRVVSGPQPEVVARPVPPMVRVGSAPGLSLLSEAAISWEVLTGILQRELTGDTLDVGGRQLIVSDIAASGLDDGRVAVGLTFTGEARGTIYLVGNPVFDPVELVLTMPDLEFDVTSRNLMVSGLAWLANSQVEEQLRTNLRVALDGVLADGRSLLEGELTRELAPGFHLSTVVDQGQVARVRARPHALLLDLVVGGTSELKLVLVPGRRVGVVP